MDSAAQAISNQQQTGGSLATGNPQDISASNLQPQQSGLQDAAQQTSEAVKMLDQGNGTIRVNGVPVVASAKTSSVVALSAHTSSTNSLMYMGLGLAVVLFMIAMYWGLMRQPK